MARKSSVRSRSAPTLLPPALARKHAAAEVEPTRTVAQPSAPASTSSGFAALLESASKEILAVTYWFDPAPHSEPYPVTVRFSGKRLAVEGKLASGDQFVQDETIEQVIPGSGPVSVTAKVHDINPGKWAVTARLLEPPRHTHGPKEPGKATSAGGTNPSLARLWSRWAPSAGSDEPVSTRPSPFVRVPGTFPLIWGILATLGFVIALALQFLVIAIAHLQVGPAWAVTLVGMAVGIAAAKVWFVVLHRSEHRIEGWCIQGFITGAILAALPMLVVLHLSVGVFLDATAPGLLVAMAVGRIGCFFAGCCGGPPTASRWGVWCSDQRVGARRVPTQLLEALLALSLGLAALVAVLVHGTANGIFFVGGLAVYTLGRQGILRLRAEPSKKWLEVVVTAALAVLVVVLAIFVQ